MPFPVPILPMHIHILGVCGTFMAGLALIARQAGHRVTGCDANVYPPMSTQLEQARIDVVQGYGADQIALAPDLWVIGNVVTRGNPLMEAILDANLAYVSGPQWFAEHVLRSKQVLAVAGTHGKTTTSSMLAWILESAGLRPGFLIGGVPEDFGLSARLTDSPLFVIEADEYDTAFFDKRSKFLHYRARIAVLNNLEYDHADIFPDLAAIETQFHHLVRTLPRTGCLVVNGADAALARVLARGCWTPVERFADDDGWAAGALDDDGFEVRRGGVLLGRVRWNLIGRHNQWNGLAALAAACRAGATAEAAIDALGRFGGVKRRMESRGTAAGVTVYDDFAHHPTAIATSIEGLRAKVGAARIIAVLEPRSNTMKLGVMKDALAPSLAAADLIFCFGADLGWDPAAALAPLGSRARWETDFEQLLSTLADTVRDGDHVLVMSNGGFNGIHDKLLARLRARHAAGGDPGRGGPPRG
jgi:UDP-N-acetylmuramate: L-alanyl-gamma-D-glutamyl-meso-diaminopimelate ligase